MKGVRTAALLLACLCATGAAAEYPDKPIRLVVPQAPGSATDTVARILGAELAKELGQQIVVDNRPGGALTLGLDLTAKADPDGYTICMGADRRARDQPPHGDEAALRHRARPAAGRAGDARASPACGLADAAVQVGARGHRLREGKSGQAPERVLQQRLAWPCRRRAVQIHERH